MGRRILVVHPGASWSTHDVYVGLTAALSDMGHEVIHYGLDARITRSASWLHHCYEAEVAAGRAAPEPSVPDYIMHAAGGIFERAAVFRVHGVLVISGMYVPTPIMAGLAHFNIPLGLILTESPYDEAHELKWASYAHMVWTNERTAVAGLRAVNPNVHYLPAAYDPYRHQPHPQMDDERAPAHDVVFVGTAFPERVELLSAVDWTGIDLGLYGNWDAVVEEGPSHPLHRHVRGGVIDNHAAAALYRRARIGLNLYRSRKGWAGDEELDRPAESLNPRAYELAACGCFQIATWRAEAGEVFALPGPGIRAIGAIYPENGLADCAERLGEQVRDYRDGEMRGHYARAATGLVRPHTFGARARRLMARFEEVLTDAWGPPGGPEAADDADDEAAARDAHQAGEGHGPGLGGVVEAAAGATLT